MYEYMYCSEGMRNEYGAIGLRKKEEKWKKTKENYNRKRGRGIWLIIIVREGGKERKGKRKKDEEWIKKRKKEKYENKWRKFI